MDELQRRDELQMLDKLQKIDELKNLSDLRKYMVSWCAVSKRIKLGAKIQVPSSP